MGDSNQIKCVICAEDATPKIVKDEAFNHVMNFLWSELQIDVKFTENPKFDLCTRCFDDILKFYDKNDMCVIMEKRIMSLQRSLLDKSLNGIRELKSKNEPCLLAQEQLVESKLIKIC